MEGEVLALLQGAFAPSAPKVHPDRCLNARHKEAGCRLCVDACPTDAIGLREGRPILDREQCARCGLCLHTCPTDAFTQARPAEATLLETVAQLGAHPVELFCPLHPEPEHTQAPVAVRVRHKRCLAALAPAHLLTLSQDGQHPLWLDDSICNRCPLGANQAAIAQTATQANRLLEALGRPPAIHRHSQEAPQLPAQAEAKPLVDGSQPRVSRRGLLGALGRRVQERAAQVQDQLPDGPAPSPRSVEERLPQQTPESRRRLLARLAPLLREGLESGALDAQAPLSTEGLPLAQVTVDAEACSGCRLCARFCPTGALAFQAEVSFLHAMAADERAAFQLTFRPALCLDCNICTVACPEDAVGLEERMPLAGLLPETEELLVQGQLVACQECRVPTAPRPGDEIPLCHVCRASGHGIRGHGKSPADDDGAWIRKLF